ncbi:uncharacterized protein LOC127863110 [Dreissena polymorpha]|uniref:C1q domain-containing protein n=1 Tax=Dreissena polymorpha TaxID=45954 RepID=A0A9D4BFD0_DREPO|nr:uncharacterized protein LOC127863110 [Dreissena polymorpha]KAH3693305.1 hypothetical protein DPMN_192709 [Dreissena polymorpha]
MFYVLASCVAVIMFGTSVAVEPSCPVCSKYEYEERLLERVLSNELALRNILNKITETQAQVEDTLKAMKAESVKINDAMHAMDVKKREIDEEMKASLQSLRKEVHEKKQDLTDKVDGFLVTGVRNLTGNVQEMSTIVQSLVAQTSKELDILKGPLVMFHARHLDGQHTYNANQDVVFKTVLVNEGGGYDSNSGRFTASVAGVYMFTVQYCSYSSNWAIPEIVHEGRSLQRSGHNDANYHVCTSMQAFAKVVKGDKVWVRSTYSSSKIYTDESLRWSSFAGLLIRV